MKYNEKFKLFPVLKENWFWKKELCKGYRGVRERGLNTENDVFARGRIVCEINWFVSFFRSELRHTRGPKTRQREYSCRLKIRYEWLHEKWRTSLKLGYSSPKVGIEMTSKELLSVVNGRLTLYHTYYTQKENQESRCDLWRKTIDIRVLKIFTGGTLRHCGKQTAVEI